MFDLKKAKIYQAVKWGGLLRYAGFLKKDLSNNFRFMSELVAMERKNF